MEIKAIPLGHIMTNCYMLSTEKTAIVIDPGFYSSIVEDFLDSNSDKERLILLTHCHFDHIGGAKELSVNTGVEIAVGEQENTLLSDTFVNMSDRFHAHVEPFSADILLMDNEVITVGDLTVKTIFTAGHTVGGVCYLIDDVLFSGDTLFFESIGRTDFPGGSFEALADSVMKLYHLLPDNTVVYPGHGEATTICHEKEFNPFVRIGNSK